MIKMIKLSVASCCSVRLGQHLGWLLFQVKSNSQSSSSYNHDNHVECNHDNYNRCFSSKSLYDRTHEWRIVSTIRFSIPELHGFNTILHCALADLHHRHTTGGKSIIIISFITIITIAITTIAIIVISIIHIIAIINVTILTKVFSKVTLALWGIYSWFIWFWCYLPQTSWSWSWLILYYFDIQFSPVWMDRRNRGSVCDDAGDACDRCWGLLWHWHMEFTGVYHQHHRSLSWRWQHTWHSLVWKISDWMQRLFIFVENL